MGSEVRKLLDFVPREICSNCDICINSSALYCIHLVSNMVDNDVFGDLLSEVKEKRRSQARMRELCNQTYIN